MFRIRAHINRSVRQSGKNTQAMRDYMKNENRYLAKDSGFESKRRFLSGGFAAKLFLLQRIHLRRQIFGLLVA